MNNYTFNQIKIGQIFSFQKKISNSLINKFVKDYGDINPLHSNFKYAKSKRFKNILVPGMLSSSFFSKLVGVYVPGKKSLLLSNNIDFIKPIYPNDTIKILGKVVNKDKKYSIIFIDAKICVNNIVCIKSKIKAKII
mgnify:CR=1 FL=1